MFRAIRGANLIDAAAIFFYPWTEPKKYSVPGVYSATAGDPRGNKNYQEVAVTSSEDSLKSGALVNTGDDTTTLPIEDAYIIIPSHKRAHVQSAARLTCSIEV